MKKTFITLIALTLSFTASTTYAGKLDPFLWTLAKEPAVGKAMLGKAVSIRDDSEQVDVLIKSSDTALTRAAIEEAGGSVRTVIGSIMTAFVPVGFLRYLDNFSEVEGVEASRRLNIYMDTARSNTGVATLQSGLGGVEYTGANVVVGVIDTGLDYSRDDFKDAQGSSRVQYLNFQTVSEEDVSYIECANDTINQSGCSITSENDSQTSHGTHVTGIAAGSDATYTGNAPAADIMIFRNDADDDINEGSGTFSGGLLDGVSEIFKKADMLDKSAVINISQGTHIGAHDNTSLMEQGINSTVTGGYDTNGKSYGRIIVVAAGNEHVVDAMIGAAANEAGGIHAAIDVADGTSKAWRLWVLASGGVGRNPLVIDAWFGANDGENCSVAANSYTYANAIGAGNTTTNAVAAIDNMPLNADDGQQTTSTDNKVNVLLITDASDSQNNKPRSLIGFWPVSTAANAWDNIEIDFDNTTGYILDVIVRASGGSCSGNMWIEGGGTYVNLMKNIDTGAFDVGNGDHGNAYAMADGDNNMSVGLPGTASGVITVGAYLQEKPFDGADRSQWTDVDGTTYDATDVNEPATAQVNGGTVGSRCPFSSIGPTADGRTKPDLLAPGDPVLSTLATGFKDYYNETYADAYGVANPFTSLQVDSTHWKTQGTSQASPQIAGLVALLLEKNNTLTAAQAKTAVTNTASAAMVIGKANDEVGYGNVNAVAAMQSISADTSGYSGIGDLTQADLDGGNGGGSSSSGGCGGTIAPVSTSSAALLAFMFLAPAAVIFTRRKKR